MINPVPFLGIHFHNVFGMLMLCHMAGVDSVMVFIGFPYQNQDFEKVP